ncbi:MAG: DNA-protecting protein DprA [Candidatus Vogelbacteria bacterium]|nr:DNA-protecting protein DprA [Candidatus Vogelbacteria bacterium]
MKNEIKKLTREETPPKLLEIPEPPKELYLEGEIPNDDFGYKYLTVVGSRKFSSYGKEACEKLIHGLAGEKIIIVSGLAIGIDTIAHESALKAKLKTIAIPGSGLSRKVLHPHSNGQLADRIVYAGGALLSELPPDMPAGTHTFPRRNRIMAGIADAILVIEAREKSGTIITARLATEYNRELLVVPGSIFSPVSVGTNRLIKQGATPINKSEDVLDALNITSSGNDYGKVGQNKLDLIYSELSENEKIIIEILSIEAMPRDELSRATKIKINELNTLITLMEIKGLIKELGGKIQIEM